MRWVIRPSFMVKMTLLRPMVSSSVSDIRRTAIPCWASSRTQLVHVLFGAHVDATRGMVEDEYRDLGCQPFGEHDLLLVATAEVQAERVGAGRLDRQLVDPFHRQFLLSSLAQEPRWTTLARLGRVMFGPMLR